MFVFNDHFSYSKFNTFYVIHSFYPFYRQHKGPVPRVFHPYRSLNILLLLASWAHNLNRVLCHLKLNDLCYKWLLLPFNPLCLLCVGRDNCVSQRNDLSNLVNFHLIWYPVSNPLISSNQRSPHNRKLLRQS